MGATGMTFTKYQQMAARTLGGNPKMTNMALGLAGETGEVVDYLKKVLFHGHELDTGKLAEELGDVLWYIAGLCSLLDIDMTDVAAGNIAKLILRYPDGFEEIKSIERDGKPKATLKD